MAKVNDYMAGREDGLNLALSIVKERGIEGLEEEIRFRGATGIHTMLAKKDLEKATVKIKEMTLDTFTILGAAVLRDEWGYGRKRLETFIERMNLKAECIMDDMASWQDYIDVMKEEVGIELRIRRND